MMASHIVNFFSTDAEGSDLLRAGMLIGHAFFLLFNVINVSYLALVQWYALRQLNKSTLLQLALAGCFLQQFSCIASVARWNEGDPHSAHFGMPSAIFGILSHAPCDMAYLFLWFHRTEQQTLIKIGCAFFALLNAVLVTVTYTKWDYSGSSFKYLIMYGLTSTLWHIVAVWRFRGEHNDGKVRISESTASSSSISRILLLAIFMDFFALCLEAKAPPAFGNGAPGLHYSSTILVMVFASGMDSDHVTHVIGKCT